MQQEYELKVYTKFMSLGRIKQGFTKVELLMIVAIVSIFLIVAFAALNPATKLQESRNTIRWNDVNSLLSAIGKCTAENSNSTASCGLLEEGMVYQIGTCTANGNVNCPSAGVKCLDLGAEPGLGAYIQSVPIDPASSGNSETTGYSVSVSSGVVTIASCLAEGGEAISVSR